MQTVRSQQANYCHSFSSVWFRSAIDQVRFGSELRNRFSLNLIFRANFACTPNDEHTKYDRLSWTGCHVGTPLSFFNNILTFECSKCSAQIERSKWLRRHWGCSTNWQLASYNIVDLVATCGICEICKNVFVLKLYDPNFAFDRLGFDRVEFISAMPPEWTVQISWDVLQFIWTKCNS